MLRALQFSVGPQPAAPGEHVLTINVVTLDGHIGIGRRPSGSFADSHAREQKKGPVERRRSVTPKLSGQRAGRMIHRRMHALTDRAAADWYGDRRRTR